MLERMRSSRRARSFWRLSSIHINSHEVVEAGMYFNQNYFMRIFFLWPCSVDHALNASAQADVTINTVNSRLLETNRLTEKEHRIWYVQCDKPHQYRPAPLMFGTCSCLWFYRAVHNPICPLWMEVYNEFLFRHVEVAWPTKTLAPYSETEVFSKDMHLPFRFYRQFPDARRLWLQKQGEQEAMKVPLNPPSSTGMGFGDLFPFYLLKRWSKFRNRLRLNSPQPGYFILVAEWRTFHSTETLSKCWVLHINYGNGAMLLSGSARRSHEVLKMKEYF